MPLLWPAGEALFDALKEPVEMRLEVEVCKRRASKTKELKRWPMRRILGGFEAILPPVSLEEEREVIKIPRRAVGPLWLVVSAGDVDLARDELSLGFSPITGERNGGDLLSITGPLTWKLT